MNSPGRSLAESELKMAPPLSENRPKHTGLEAPLSLNHTWPFFLLINTLLISVQPTNKKNTGLDKVVGSLLAKATSSPGVGQPCFSTRLLSQWGTCAQWINSTMYVVFLSYNVRYIGWWHLYKNIEKNVCKNASRNSGNRGRLCSRPALPPLHFIEQAPVSSNISKLYLKKRLN